MTARIKKIRHVNPFDDSHQKDRRRSTRANTDTSAIDAYRQGVELTNPTHFANGIAKIHDGYNDQSGNHEVPTLILGQGGTRPRDENSFVDDTKLNPLDRFIEPPGTAIPTFFQILGGNLAHLWDRYDGTTWTDSVGGLNAVAQTTAPARARVNDHTYPVFDGVNTGMEAANTAVLDGLSNWCIFGAMRTNNGQAFGAIIDHAQQFYVELSFGAGAMIITSQAAGELDGVAHVNDNRWHRFIVNVVSGLGTLYIDNSVDATSVFDPLLSTLNPILLGVQPNTTVTDSAVAVVGVGSRGLTLLEIEALDRTLCDWVGLK